MTNTGCWFALWRRLSDEMVSRGPWDTDAAERRVKGFYKFSMPGEQLDELAYRRMRDIDPGLPEWAEFLRLLEGGQLRALVVG